MPASPRLITADQKITHGDLQEFLLVFPCLAASQNSLLDVFTARASQRQLRACLVDLHNEVEVLHRNFAGSASATSCMGAGLGLTPRPALQGNLAFVFGILALALNAVDLQKIINQGHLLYLLCLSNESTALVRFHSRPCFSYFRAEAGRSATKRNDTESSSSWKCGLRNAIAR